MMVKQEVRNTKDLTAVYAYLKILVKDLEPDIFTGICDIVFLDIIIHFLHGFRVAITVISRDYIDLFTMLNKLTRQFKHNICQAAAF